MRARGLCVHVGCPNRSIFEACLHILLHLGNAIDFQLKKVLHEYTLFRALFQLHPSLHILAQEIVNLLVIYLNEAAAYEMILCCLTLSKSYDLAKGSGDDSLALFALATAHHRVSFTAASLPVGEDCAVVAIENTVNEGECGLLVDQGLGALRPEYVIVREALGRFLGVFFEEMNLFAVRVNLYNADAG
jgi:hypothetical protein